MAVSDVPTIRVQISKQVNLDTDAQGPIFYIGLDVWSAGEVKLVFPQDNRDLFLNALRKSREANSKISVTIWDGDYSSNSLIGASFIADIIIREAETFPTINLSYLPYSRQERATDDSPYMGTKLIEKLFRGCTIVTDDLHNPESNIPGVRNEMGAVVVNNIALMMARNEITPMVFVAPDEGATDRALRYTSTYSRFYDMPVLTICLKKERKDGMVVSYLSESNKDLLKSFMTNYPRTNIVVVDDILDGGRTLVNAGNIILGEVGGEFKDHLHLSITHGIFSSSSTEAMLRKTFKNITVANTVKCIKRHD